MKITHFEAVGPRKLERRIRITHFEEVRIAPIKTTPREILEKPERPLSTAFGLRQPQKRKQK